MRLTVLFDPGNALEIAAERKILIDAHLRIEGKLLRQIPDIPLCGVCFCENVVSVDPHRAGGCAEISGEDIHRGGLSRAVEPEKSHDLALADAEAHVRKRLLFPVIFDQMFNFDQLSSLLYRSAILRSIVR